MRVHTVTGPDGADVRAYTAVETAGAFNVTAKTIIAWADSGRRGGPRLRAWPPRTVDPGEHRWLVDADDVDRLLAGSGPSGTDNERAGLDEERHLFELERSMFLRERTHQLEDDNARLGDEVARLQSQLEVLGEAIRALTARSI